MQFLILNGFMIIVNSILLINNQSHYLFPMLLFITSLILSQTSILLLQIIKNQQTSDYIVKLYNRRIRWFDISSFFIWFLAIFMMSIFLCQDYIISEAARFLFILVISIIDLMIFIINLGIINYMYTFDTRYKD